MQITQHIKLNIYQRSDYTYLDAKQADDNSRFLNVQFTDGDNDIFVTSGVTVTLRCQKPDGTAVYNNGTRESDGTVTVELTDQVLAVPGVVYADISTSRNGEILSSATFVIRVIPVPTGTQIVSTNEFLQLTELIEELEQLDVVQLQQDIDGLAESMASEYSSSSTYALGDYVIYDDYLYRCTTAITTAEAWNVNHWTQISLSSEINGRTMVLRGLVTALGYTSLEECSKSGAYWFNGSQASTITDLPTDFPENNGGLCLTYNLGNTYIWQMLYATRYVWVRYGLTGDWQKVGDFYDLYRIENNTIREQLSISTLGYSSLGQCEATGFYRFTTSDAEILTDLPEGWVGGGLAITWKTGTVIYQELIASNGLRFIRYGLNGIWRNMQHLIKAEYVAGSGADSSTERLLIDIPFSQTRRIRYELGHCIDDSANANVWRIMYIYLIEATPRQLNIEGEFECAVHLKDRSDFSGGIVHGDEIDQNVSVLADGVLINIAECTGYYDEIRIVKSSNLYDPSNPSVAIAEHGSEYIFSFDGLRLKQTIKWLVAEDLTNCYMCMYPVIKAYSDYYYSDIDYAVKHNEGSSYQIQLPDCKMVTEFNPTYKTMSAIQLIDYPEGLTGGDRALIMDNGGRNYHKVYFVVCSSGTSTIGEIWKSDVMYIIK